MIFPALTAKEVESYNRYREVEIKALYDGLTQKQYPLNGGSESQAYTAESIIARYTELGIKAERKGCMVIVGN